MWQASRSWLALALVTVLFGVGTAGCQLSGSSGPSKGKGARTVTYEVNGTAPSGVDITYGDDTSNYQGTLPLYKTLPIRDGALYEHVTAQLQGSGDVTCRVTIGDAVKEGRAIGGFNICSAQLNHDPISGGWG